MLNLTGNEPNWAGARQLLRRLRDVMAGDGSTQVRLDRIVRIIADSMIAEVCSIYVLRPGRMLELAASEGLLPESVHRTRLAFGEGLIGVIAAQARHLALADAQSHPDFAYRPETGEEAYTSLMGVPVMRGGRVQGVLAVQNVSPRTYTEEEIEAMETVAMVVAELVVDADGTFGIPNDGGQAVSGPALQLPGQKLAPGLALGQVVLHEKQISISRMVSEDPVAELERLAAAVSRMHRSLDTMLESYGRGAEGDHVDILRAYRMIAEDRGWLGRTREAIRSGLTAEAAVAKIQNDTRARMNQVADPYIRERLQDLANLAYRLIEHLAGATAGKDEALPEKIILVARNMGPAELLDYDRSRLCGLVLEEGSETAHVTIVARALEIPLVGQVDGILNRVEPGVAIAIDGDNGEVFLRPDENFRATFRENMNLLESRRAAYADTRHLPVKTRDGSLVSLNFNAGLLLDLAHLAESGADGVGLYRTELPFMMRPRYPDFETQLALYRDIFGQAAGRPVTFRTLDIGGDKLMAAMPSTGEEENPALGWRALRIGLDQPRMLRDQLRALIVAADGRPLRVMFPMVTEVTEFDAARDILSAVMTEVESAGGIVPATLAVGTMLEVPALLFQLKALLSRVDFLSVGSNDLSQFVFASDRGNPRLSGRYDTLAPAFLKILHEIVQQCDAANVPVSLCGEMAGNPLEAMALIGLGYRSLSMQPGSVGAVRMMVRSLDASRLRAELDASLDLPDHSLRGALIRFAADHEVDISLRGSTRVFA
ncbi:MAG: phosphoenolpyruvate--protein phosphotransferase [Alphaproteobacteria bacterium]